MENYFSCAQVAEKYGVKTLTVWQWIRDRKLGAIKTGKIYSIPPQALKDFDNKHKTIRNLSI